MKRVFVSLAALVAAITFGSDAFAQYRGYGQGAGYRNLNVRNDPIGYRKWNGYPVATAYAPSNVYGGLNECGASTNAGFQVPLFGFSFGIPSEQRNCTLRANARALETVRSPAARVYLANDPEMRAAMVATGQLIEAQRDARGNWYYPGR
jgi:hypothetical protein